ncbi:tRNA pseudouridine(55) synthase TruB [Anaerofustis stercorihominis]|uniref:tRNA pseudouridine synthase B n=1 Tax=Anaerofustis stercorihominis TaxID=214853 RepID=A0A3E3E3W0_9FIRM|nr:tRNA pseudouridine(55) synthase TruB [Anaerofustis stercorihominis]RGD75588.1 tRNA pseudouridine(55) synthase TruB [Anaerofustis stercorihominis]
MLNGVICINKEQDMTSHDVCFKVRKILGTKKVGHSGTLDPMAEGVMGVLVGRSTKLSSYITSFDKEYIAGIKFGKDSDSYDIWTDMKDVLIPDFTQEDFKKVINRFVGDITQTPPIYSAIKVKGKPLYKYALNGEEVEIPSREVYIDSIEIIETNLPYSAKIKVSCSKGTYIRSLIHDIGVSLGTSAVMDSLVRTKNGVLNIENSITLSNLEDKVKAGRVDEVIKRDDYFLTDIHRVDVNPSSGKILLNGNGLIKKNLITPTDDIKLGTTVRLYLEDKFIGLGKKTDEEGILIRPIKILYGE